MSVATLERTETAEGLVLDFPSAQRLMWAVENAMLFTAGAKADVPVLHAVRFERTADGVLTVVACDRYQLFTQQVEHTGEKGAEFAFSLEVGVCKQLVQTLKAAGRFLGATVTVEESALKVSTVTSLGATEGRLPHQVDAGEFPKWRGLVSKPEDAEDTPHVHLNPKTLGSVAKLKLSEQTPAKFTFYGPLKPVRIDLTDQVTIMQMPVRG